MVERSAAYIEFASLFSSVLLSPDLEEPLKPRLNELWEQLAPEEQGAFEKLVADAVAQSQAKKEG